MRNKQVVQIQTLTVAMAFAAVTVFYQCTHEPQAPALPDTVSFSAHILPLFRQECSITACHTGTNPAGNLNLSDAVAYDRLFAKNEIDTLVPTKSLLYRQMNSSGTPMPPSGRLGDYEVGLVLRWIEQGAKRD
ncbi:MAG: hypothetical protein WCR52_06215 [Bacteroidota bacterium]